MVRFPVVYDDTLFIYEGPQTGYEPKAIDIEGLSLNEREILNRLIIQSSSGKFKQVLVTKVDTKEEIVVYRRLLKKPTLIEFMKYQWNNRS